jgi:hypothetical protein
MLHPVHVRCISCLLVVLSPVAPVVVKLSCLLLLRASPGVVAQYLQNGRTCMWLLQHQLHFMSLQHLHQQQSAASRQA